MRKTKVAESSTRAWNRGMAFLKTVFCRVNSATCCCNLTFEALFARWILWLRGRNNARAKAHGRHTGAVDAAGVCLRSRLVPTKKVQIDEWIWLIMRGQRHTGAVDAVGTCLRSRLDRWVACECTSMHVQKKNRTGAAPIQDLLYGVS